MWEEHTSPSRKTGGGGHAGCPPDPRGFGNPWGLKPVPRRGDPPSPDPAHSRHSIFRRMYLNGQGMGRPYKKNLPLRLCVPWRALRSIRFSPDRPCLGQAIREQPHPPPPPCGCAERGRSKELPRERMAEALHLAPCDRLRSPGEGAVLLHLALRERSAPSAAPGEGASLTPRPLSMRSARA